MIILGTGGHAKVVIDAAISSGNEISAVFDDDPDTHQSSLSDIPVKGYITKDLEHEAVIAIGSNIIRKNIDDRCTKCRWKTIIHPSAIIASDVEIGEGTVVMAGAVIQSGTRIGRHCIINTRACIDHDCEIGDFAHVAPNCSIAGGVKIGEGTLVGIGSSCIQYKEIGSWSTIGAGSVIISDIPDNCTAVGNPAKVISNHE